MALTTTIGAVDADSYATLAEYQARAAAMGWTLSGTDGGDEINLRRAAVVIDSTYTFRGDKATAEQALEWPRVDGIGYGALAYYDPYPIRSDEIPAPVKAAQMEMAHLIQGGADPLATFDGAVKREKLDVIEVEYTGGKARPRFTAVDRILRHYIIGGPGQVGLVRA